MSYWFGKWLMWLARVMTKHISLEVLASSCASGACPTVYRTDSGSLVVQGYTVSAERAGIDLPDGEMLVEIPAELLSKVHYSV